jgi:hypothetical protein
MISSIAIPLVAVTAGLGIIVVSPAAVGAVGAAGGALAERNPA